MPDELPPPKTGGVAVVGAAVVGGVEVVVGAAVVGGVEVVVGAAEAGATETGATGTALGSSALSAFVTPQAATTSDIATKKPTTERLIVST